MEEEFQTQEIIPAYSSREGIHHKGNDVIYFSAKDYQVF